MTYHRQQHRTCLCLHIVHCLLMLCTMCSVFFFVFTITHNVTSWSQIIGGSETMDNSLDHRWMCEKMLGAYDIKNHFLKGKFMLHGRGPQKSRKF